jgi:hypothetical protein
MAGEGKEEAVDTTPEAQPPGSCPGAEVDAEVDAAAAGDADALAAAAAAAATAAEKAKHTTRIFNAARKRFVARFGGTNETEGRHVFFNKLTTNQMVALEADEQGLAQTSMCSVFSLRYATAEEVCNGDEPWVMDRVPLEDTEAAPAASVSFLNVIMDPETARQIDGANPRLRKSKAVISFKDTPHILCIVTRTK